MKNEDIELVFSFHKERISFYENHINKLFFTTILAGILTIVISFNIFYIIPLIVICLIDDNFDKYHYKSLQLRLSILTNRFNNTKYDHKDFILKIKDISFKCGILFSLFLLLSIIIVVFFWINILELTGITIW